MSEARRPKLRMMLQNITDLITQAHDCQTELAHIKLYHNEAHSEDLVAQFALNERLRHIAKIEERLNKCLGTLSSHEKTVAELINFELID